MSASTTSQGFSPREYRNVSGSGAFSGRTDNSTTEDDENTSEAVAGSCNECRPLYSDGAAEGSSDTASFTMPRTTKSSQPFSQARRHKPNGAEAASMDQKLRPALRRRQTSSTLTSSPSSSRSSTSQTSFSTSGSPPGTPTIPPTPTQGDLTATTSSVPSGAPLPTRLPRRNSVAMIAGTLVAAIAILASLLVIFIVGCRRQKRRRRYSTGSSTSTVGETPPHLNHTANASISTHFPSSTMDTERGALDSVAAVGSRGSVEDVTFSTRRPEAVVLSDAPPAYERHPSPAQ